MVGFLFDRVSYYFSKEKPDPVTKGDNEEDISKPMLEEHINLARKRAKIFRISFLLFIVLLAASILICIFLDDKVDRIITASINILVLFVANFLSWSEYAEKLYGIADYLEDMTDKLEFDGHLSNHDKVRIKRVISVIKCPLLFSDHQYKGRVQVVTA
jgi:hypothetical protein